ncbi:MAG: amidohydrolase family protein [Pirellulaceae bacterium]
MTPVPEPWALQARLVFPISAPPRRNCAVTIAGDRIVAVGENRSGGPVVDLGDVAILPGLINAHTHLEFSQLAHPLGCAGISFPDWIAEVVRRQRDAATSLDTCPQQAARRARCAGLHECLTHGVTTVGDIVSVELDGAAGPHLPLTWYAFREMLGFSAERRAQQLPQIDRHVQQVTATARMRTGLSPHAPYSTERELVTLACRLSHRRSWPVAMHLAESREELQLLATGHGPMRDMLEELAVWHPEMFAGGGQVRDYLQILASAYRCLVIHGNYLPIDDWEFLAQRAQRMAVVYCPRTHHYFGHEPYPLAAMLSRGVRVILGTDSRASNPDLSLWEEMRFVARTHPQVTPTRILQMATLDAARALGCQDDVGSVEPGKRADLVLMRIDPSPATDPCAAILHADDARQTTMCGGRFQDDLLRRDAFSA